MIKWNEIATVRPVLHREISFRAASWTYRARCTRLYDFFDISEHLVRGLPRTISFGIPNFPLKLRGSSAEDDTTKYH